MDRNCIKCLHSTSPNLKVIYKRDATLHGSVCYYFKISIKMLSFKTDFHSGYSATHLYGGKSIGLNLKFLIISSLFIYCLAVDFMKL